MKSLSVSLFSIKSCYPIDSVVSIIIWKIEDDTFFWPEWKVKNTSLFFLILYSVRSFKALLGCVKNDSSVKMLPFVIIAVLTMDGYLGAEGY